MRVAAQAVFAGGLGGFLTVLALVAAEESGAFALSAAVTLYLAFSLLVLVCVRRWQS